MRQVDCPSLVFIDFNVPMLTQGRIGVFWECSPPWALSSRRELDYSKSELYCDWWSVNQEVLVSSPTRYLLPFDSYSLVFVRGPFDERMGLSFVYAAGPRQHSLSWVCVPWDSRPYFTVSLLRLPFPLPSTARRVTIYVFHLASTRVSSGSYSLLKQIRYSTIKSRYFLYCRIDG
jgi:hypothetical protein